MWVGDHRQQIRRSDRMVVVVLGQQSQRGETNGGQRASVKRALAGDATMDGVVRCGRNLWEALM